MDQLSIPSLEKCMNFSANVSNRTQFGWLWLWICILVYEEATVTGIEDRRIDPLLISMLLEKEKRRKYG